ncbi:MAG: protein kinase [bacterium]
MNADPLIGQVLDSRYQIDRKLGEGGMGCVYLARHVRTGRPCALKLLPAEAALDASSVRRFEREAQVLGALGHPGIVGVHDFSETPDGRPFLVMDYLEGEDLSQRLERAGALDWDSAKRIFSEMAGALWAAHRAGVLHRDLKPANVFLAHMPSTPERAVLLDFGLAKQGAQEATHLTRTGVVLGTPLYMSPEQARGDPVDERSDIYSLAAILFEMLAGQPPFVGPTFTAVLSKLLVDPPPRLSALATRPMPAHLDEVLESALAKDPAARQPDATALATAVLHERPAWAAEPAFRPTLSADSTPVGLAMTMPSSPPVRTPHTAAPGASASGAVPATESAHDVLTPSSSAIAAPPPAKTRRSLLLGVLIGVTVAGLASGGAVYWMTRPRTKSSGTEAGTNRLAAKAPETDAAATAAAATPSASAPVDASAPTPAALKTTPDGAVTAPRQPIAPPRRFGVGVAARRPRPTRPPAPPPRPAMRSQAPPTAPPLPSKLSGHFRLLALHRQKKFAECVRTARKMSPTRNVLKMGIACASSSGNRSNMITLCRTFVSRYPNDLYAKMCRSVLLNYLRLKRLQMSGSGRSPGRRQP